MPIEEPKVPGLFSIDQMELLYEIVLDAGPESAVEIGSYMGRSTYAICLALEDLGGQRTLVCVDSWEQLLTPDYYETAPVKRLFKLFPNVDAKYTEASGESLMSLFEHTLERYPIMKSRVTARNVDSRDVDLSDLSIDFAFLDGDHRFAGVKNDVLKVLPSATDNTMTVVFHDYAERYPGVIRVVDACVASAAASEKAHVGNTVAVIVHDASALAAEIAELRPEDI